MLANHNIKHFLFPLNSNETYALINAERFFSTTVNEENVINMTKNNVKRSSACQMKWKPMYWFNVNNSV